MKKLLLLSLTICLLPSLARGANRIAASASQADVQAAVNASADGDTVLIPNGSATWTTGIVTNKQIIIRAQNYTPTAQPTASTVRNVVITYDGKTSHAFDMTSGDRFNCGVGGIKFLPPSPGGQGGSSTGIWGYVHFKGSGSKPPLLFDCHFVGNDRENVTSSEASFLSIDSLGGVVWNTFFDGTQVPDGTSVAQEGMGGAGIHLYGWGRPWNSQSTMGTLDTGGNVNVYFEDCSFLVWGQADVDNSARTVIRKSTMNGSGWQTHGFTSGSGGRHVEMYDNNMINTVSNRNFYRYFWLRGGTVLFTDNAVSNQNTGYGYPSLLNIGDNTNPSGAYPINMAPGRGYWTGHVADPIYMWNNSGGAGSAWGVQSAWQSQVQLNRDIFVNSGAKPGVPGSGGTPWAKYRYPHPMRAVVEGEGPAPTPTPPGPTPSPTPGPTPPPSGNESPDCTKSRSVTDSTGAVWTLSTASGSGDTLRNGVHVGDGAGELYKYVSHQLFLFNGTSWWKWTGAAWQNIGAEPTCGTPTPTPTPVPTPPPQPTPTPTPEPTPPPQPTPTPPPSGAGGAHTHSIDDIIGMRELLQNPMLMAKPTPTPAPSGGGAHRHSVEDIDGLR
jgi:hypothetical protein